LLKAPAAFSLRFPGTLRPVERAGMVSNSPVAGKALPGMSC